MSSLAADERPEAPLFSDGLGERVVAADGATGELLQILRLRPALTAVPSFEFALRERAARLANFRHTYYARVRRIDRTMAPTPALAIVSDHIEGTRLSDLLRVAHESSLQLDVNAALCLIRQLVPAVAVLHENARDVAHGIIAPERLIVTPNARLVIAEHVLGAAIEQLQYGRDRLWQDFRVAMPPSAGLPRFDHRADVTGMGLVALALILGRPLRTEEYPHHLPALLNEARERTALGYEQPLSPPLRAWLSRALQMDVRRAFASAPEALASLEEIVADDSMYVAAPVALETFLSRYTASLLEPPAAPEPAAAQVPPARMSPAAPAWPEPAVAPAPINDFADFAASLESSVGSSYDYAPVELPAPPFVESPYGATRTLSGAHDLRELLGSEPLPTVERVERVERVEPVEPVTVRAAAPQSLFNPDAPFTAAATSYREPEPPRKSRGPIVAIVAVLLLLGVGGAYGLKWYNAPSGAPELGTLTVQSSPKGVAVVVDGVERGVTPARLTLAPGSHILELRGRGVPRVIPINVTPGAQLSQYLEFAEAPATGQLAVQSEPSGAKVLVDGVERGVAPLTVPDLVPGDHRVELQAEGASARHTVSVQAGGTASLVVPMAGSASTGPISGWVSVTAPFTLEVHEQGRLLGTTDTDRIMMAAGRHELELVSTALGYRSTRVVQVPPGKVAAVTLDLPKGIVNLNAAPWAEVWIDGQRVGETPIGNLSVAIGPHEIVFKHPQLGEKRHAVSVTLDSPIRLSVDMK